MGLLCSIALHVLFDRCSLSRGIRDHGVADRPYRGTKRTPIARIAGRTATLSTYAHVAIHYLKGSEWLDVSGRSHWSS
jgi:hypothetical protein